MTKAADCLAPIIRHSDFVILSSFGIRHSSLRQPMRFRFKPTTVQRVALRAQLVRFDQPAAVLEILRPVLPAGFKTADILCTVQSVHPDRFVTRVRARSETGEDRAYALKVYSDDFVERVWTHSQALAEHTQPEYGGSCSPTHCNPQERLLPFASGGGRFLS